MSTRSLEEILDDLRELFTGKTLDERLDACREIGRTIGLAPVPGSAPVASNSTYSPTGAPVAGGRSPGASASFTPPKVAAKPVKYGYDCARCGTHNPDAEANQTDGSYICFNCRS